MHYIVLMMIAFVTLPAYLVELRIAPSAAKFLPEVLSAVVAIYVVLAGMKNRFELVRAQYWLLFGAATVVILCGIIANSVGPGPIIAGLRYYFRAIPFFFLAAVYPFKDWQIRQHLVLLCAIALLQLPIAVYQRYALLQEGRFTGDFVYGTLLLSPTLTIFLLSGICIIVAMLMKGQLSKVKFATLFVLFLIPTTINETKITVFLLPLGILTTMMMATAKGKRLRTFGVSVVLTIVAAAIFVPIYDYLGRQNVATKDAYSITDMFTKEGYFEKYLDQGTEVGDTKEVGRVDAVSVPVNVISRDPVSMAFGLGLGNASISSIGAQFSGAHSASLGRYATGASSAGSMLLEIGVLGFMCAYALHWLIFRDSLIVVRHSDTQGLICVIAIAWPAVLLIYSLTFFYSAPISVESLSYLFWFFSGLIAARRMQLNVTGASSRTMVVSNLPISQKTYT